MGMHSNTFGAPSTQTFQGVASLKTKNSIRAAQKPTTGPPANAESVGIRVLLGGKPAFITFPRPQPPPSPGPRPRPGPGGPRPPPGNPTPPPTPRRPAGVPAVMLGGGPELVTLPHPQPLPSPRPRPRPGPVRPPPGNPTPPPTPRR